VRNYVSMLVRATLEGPEVQTAGDFDEAIAAYRASRPDLVLLDINMIGPSGFEILRHLREIDPAAVVVMLTSVSARRSVEEAVQDGARGYLLKELPHEQLADELRQLMVRLFSAEPPAPSSL
jgi:DNA-binding NarL/FixJ family response regulator